MPVLAVLLHLLVAGVVRSIFLFLWFGDLPDVINPILFDWHHWQDGNTSVEGCVVTALCSGTWGGDNLVYSCPIWRTKVPEYPLCASCSECGVIALLAKCHEGPLCCALFNSNYLGHLAKASRITSPLSTPTPPTSGTLSHSLAHP